MGENQKISLLSRVAKTRKNQIGFSVFALLSIAVMIIIFVFSSQKAEDSAALSGEFGGFLEKMLSGLEWLLGKNLLLWIKAYLRKIAHFVLYTLLGAFVMAAMLNTKIEKTAIKVVICAATGLAYSISDEIHQLFVEGRSGEVRDVLLDFSGVLSGVVITLVLCKIFQIIAKNRKKA